MFNKVFVTYYDEFGKMYVKELKYPLDYIEIEDEANETQTTKVKYVFEIEKLYGYDDCGDPVERVMIHNTFITGDMYDRESI